MYLLVSFIWCLIGPLFLFLVFFRDSFIKNLPIEAPYAPIFAGWGFIVFLLLIGFLSFIIRAYRETLQVWTVRFGRQACIMGTVLLLIAFSLAGWYANNSPNTKQFMILRASRKNHWETVLNLGKNLSAVTPYSCIQTNRALWYTGILLDSAFAYPQNYGPFGLVPNRDLCLADPEIASYLFFELGLISESLHWSHEFMEVSGEIPEILERIGLIYLLKGEPETAKMFWKKFGHTIQGRKKAQSLIVLTEQEKLLEHSKKLKKLHSFMPDFEFISIGDPSDRELLLLLKQNPGNRMAFDYWILYNV